MPQPNVNPALRRYRLFGLTIVSELDLPGLAEGNEDAHGDVVIRLVASQAPPMDADIVVDGIARFQVADESTILVQPAAGAAPRNVRLYLLGSAMGLLLHRRGWLPLHANAVDLGGKAIAFMGQSGVGKSTLAAWFHDRGHPILADDVCAIRLAEGSPVAVPGLPRLRLWREALEAGGRAPDGYERSYAGDEDWEKYDVPLDRHAEEGEYPLAGIYLLEAADEFAVNRLTGLAVAEALFANTYRGMFVAQQGDPRSHWQICLTVAATVPIFRLTRQWGLGRFERDALAIEAHLRQLTAD